MVAFERLAVEQAHASFFCEESASKEFSSAGRAVCVATSQPYHCGGKAVADNMRINGLVAFQQNAVYKSGPASPALGGRFLIAILQK